VSLNFTPTAVGNVNSTLVFTDNASPATQTVHLNGMGLALLTPTVHVTVGLFVYDGQAQTATCTATSAGGATVPGTCSPTYNGTATAPSNVGIYNVTATFSSTSPYFGNATGIGKLTIAPARLPLRPTTPSVSKEKRSQILRSPTLVL
jgi:hypothetical protein